MASDDDTVWIEVSSDVQQALEDLTQRLYALTPRERAAVRDLLLLRLLSSVRHTGRRMTPLARLRLDALIARAGLPPLDWT